MVRREWLAIMMRGQKNIIAVQISQGNVCRKTLLRVYQNMSGLSFWLDPSDEFTESDALPSVVKTAPARDTVKVTRVAGLR